MRAILRIPFHHRYLSMMEVTQMVHYWAHAGQLTPLIPGPPGTMWNLPNLTQPLKSEAMQVAQGPP
jgi:hypothetical protein